MKILAVSPVPNYATWDVYQGHVKGLKALGNQVIEMNYSRIHAAFSDFAEMMIVTGRAEYGSINGQLMAGDRIVASALVNEVDLVYMVAPMHIERTTLKVLQMLRKLGTRTALYFTECPYDDKAWQAEFSRLTDFAFVCDPTSLPAFHEHNPASFYIGHAYDPERHRTNGKVQPDIDVLQVTTLFPSRRAFLEAVDWTGIDFHLYGITPLGNQSPIHRFVRGPSMKNEAVVELYHKAKISFQLHRNDTITLGRKLSPAERKAGMVAALPNPDLKAHSLGPRVYELAACGTFQVCDDTRPELTELFGEAVPTYSTPSELGDLCRHYLAADGEREELAKQQHEAIKPYTFENRMKQVMEVIDA